MGKNKFLKLWNMKFGVEMQIWEKIGWKDKCLVFKSHQSEPKETHQSQVSLSTILALRRLPSISFSFFFLPSPVSSLSFLLSSLRFSWKEHLSLPFCCMRQPDKTRGRQNSWGQVSGGQLAGVSKCVEQVSDAESSRCSNAGHRL